MNNTLNLQGERLGLFNPITGLDNKSFAKVKKNVKRLIHDLQRGKMAYAWLQLQAGATIQRSRYKEAVTWSETNPDLPAQKKMFRTPDVYGYFTSTFTPVKRLAISFTGTYTGTMLVQHLAGYIPEDREEKTPDFFDLNMKVAYDFPLYKSVTLQVNAGVQNIFEAYQSDFDQGKDRDSKYIYGPGMPRSYFVGCKISY